MCHHEGVERKKKKSNSEDSHFVPFFFYKGKQIRTHNMSEFHLVYFIDGYSSEYISSKHKEKTC